MISHVYIILISAISLFFLVAAIQKKNVNDSAVIEAIDKTYIQFSKAWSDHNAEGIAATWSKNASFITPDSETDIIRSRKQIHEMYSSRFDQVRNRRVQTSITFFILDRTIEGDLATDVGYAKSVTKSDEMGETVSIMKMIVVLKRDRNDGTWKFHADSFSDSSPQEFKQMKKARKISL